MSAINHPPGLFRPFPFLAWSLVALAISWFWADELVRVHNWAMNNWFMELPYVVRLIVRQAHWVFYFGFGLLFFIELIRGRRKEAGVALVYLAANLLIAFFLIRVLKMGLGRPRPFMESHGAVAWQPFAGTTHFESLPSGHTTDAFVGAGLIQRLYASAWWRWSALGVALLVGASRVALGKHYPSDVIAGMILGYLGGYWLARMWQKGGFRPVIKACARGAAGAAIIALSVWAASSAQGPEVRWKEAHGGIVTASPLLLPGQALGQPLRLPSHRLSHLTLYFGTHHQKGTGRVELRLLSGTETPLEERELVERSLARKEIPAKDLIDNGPLRWEIGTLRLAPGQGLYLVVNRMPGDDPPSRLSVWLDQGRDWTSGPAQVLFTQERGFLTAQMAQGHISLGVGFDRRPSLMEIWLETPRGLQISWLVQLVVMLGVFLAPWPGGRIGVGGNPDTSKDEGI